MLRESSQRRCHGEIAAGCASSGRGRCSPGVCTKTIRHLLRYLPARLLDVWRPRLPLLSAVLRRYDRHQAVTGGTLGEAGSARALAARPPWALCRLFGTAQRAARGEVGDPDTAPAGGGRGCGEDENTSWSWARLLGHVFALDIATCPLRRGGSLWIIAAITQESVITRTLRHLKLTSVPPPIAPPRLRQETFDWVASAHDAAQSGWETGPSRPSPGAPAPHDCARVAAQAVCVWEHNIGPDQAVLHASGACTAAHRDGGDALGRASGVVWELAGTDGNGRRMVQPFTHRCCACPAAWEPSRKSQHEVDPTNNRAERALRFGVLWRQRSQGRPVTQAIAEWSACCRSKRHAVCEPGRLIPCWLTRSQVAFTASILISLGFSRLNILFPL